jgi:hypothetical protein
MEEFPESLGHSREKRFVRATALLNPQDRMKEAANDNNGGEQTPPGHLGGIPAIEVDRFWFIARVMGSGLARKHPIGLR